MSREPLQERLDPLKLAKAGAVLKGSLSNRAMPRLTEGLTSSDGETEVELAFDLDAVGRVCISGRARTQIELVCQRCLKPFKQLLDVSFELVQVQSEAEAERLPPEVDPLFSEESLIRSAELIEDELILALPIIAAHAEQSECDPGEKKTAAEEVGSDKPNPFAVLANLKRNEH